MMRLRGMRRYIIVANNKTVSSILIKVTLEAQLGLIGGTMGLLTGFSILSGIEIVYYLIKLVNMQSSFDLRLSLSIIDHHLKLYLRRAYQSDMILRFFVNLKISRTSVMSAVSKRSENHLTRRD